MLVDVGRIRETKGASCSARGSVVFGDVLGRDFHAAGPADASITLTNTGRIIHAEGEIKLGLQTECVRCLTPMEIPLTIPFCQDYASNTPDEDTDQELQLFSGDRLDLTPAILETVLLALPMKPLCQEDCPGLCPQCGRDLKQGVCGCRREALHPGMAALERLLPKKEV